MTGQKTAGIAKLGNVAHTVSYLTLARLKEQIQKPAAIDPCSYVTRIAHYSWLGPLCHGDVLFPT